jgi:hypothetical protein
MPMEDHALGDGVICLIPKSHKLSNYDKNVEGAPSSLYKENRW